MMYHPKIQAHFDVLARTMKRKIMTRYKMIINQVIKECEEKISVFAMIQKTNSNPISHMVCTDIIHTINENLIDTLLTELNTNYKFYSKFELNRKSTWDGGQAIVRTSQMSMFDLPTSIEDRYVTYSYFVNDNDRYKIDDEDDDSRIDEQDDGIRFHRENGPAIITFKSGTTTVTKHEFFTHNKKINTLHFI
jgi:hypothetical protein